MDLTKRELLLEKRLNDISTSAIPKVEKEPIMPVISTPRPAHDMGMTPDQLDLRDLAYEARLNTIATNSIVQKLGWKPTKIKSDTTKEMVADYLREQALNVNEKGLYLPANLDLDLEPDIVATDISGEATYLVAEKRRLLNEAKALEEELKRDAPAEFKKIDDKEEEYLTDYTIFLSSLEPVMVEYQYLTGLKPSIDQLFKFAPSLNEEDKDMLENHSDTLKGFDEKRDAIKRVIEAVRRQIAENEYNADQIDARLAQLTDLQRAERAEQAAIVQRNDQRKRAYADQVRLLNSGRMIPEQLPDETSEEYKTRLEQTGITTPDPNSVDAASKLFFTDVLREKLQEILSDEGDISTFIKDMDGDERYLVAKNFPEFKKRFQDVMGKDKVRASGGTMKLLLDLKDNLVGTIAQKKADEAKKEVEEAADLIELVPPDTEALGALRDEIDKSKQLTANQRDNLRQFIKDPLTERYDAPAKTDQAKKAAYDGFRDRIQKVHDSTRVAPAPRTLTRQTTEELVASKPAKEPQTDQETYRMLIDGIRARRDEIQRADPQEQDAGLQGEDEALARLVQTKNLQQLEDAARLDQIDLQQFVKPSGKGIGRKHAEKVAFGRVDIHPNRLFYDNILRITKSGRDLTGFPQKKVSDAFVDVVFTVLKGQTPTLRAFKKMGEEERKLYDTLVFMSGLSKEVEHTGSGVKEDLKKRLQLIEGEIEAGNTNPLLIKEARQVLHHMAQMKMVARPKAVAHLKQLQAFQRS